ncbi:hypothetical protein [Actinoplanes sp. NPDC051851]|uniref:HAAS signaling domain-containing protein n=1 Tax=Actinoplanes sp. NPDC051851 TaxID=3154753 RepID=UPI003426F950
MKANQTDVVGEYLHEVDLRLSGLPLLQRRELLADLAAHIASERTERNVQSEGELLEILERLGSPEVVAAAAYDEAGTRPPRPAPKPSRRTTWIVAAAAGGAVLVVLMFCAFFAFAGGSETRPVPAEVATAPAEVGSAPAEVAPVPTVTG